MVLSWVLHQVPRRRGKCSPFICRITGCMVGCGRWFPVKSSDRRLPSVTADAGCGLEEMRQDPRFGRERCALRAGPGSRLRGRQRGLDSAGTQHPRRRRPAPGAQLGPVNSPGC